MRKLAVEAADNGLLAPELAAGITRVKGAKSKGVRLGNWLSLRQAQALLNIALVHELWLWGASVPGPFVPKGRDVTHL